LDLSLKQNKLSSKAKNDKLKSQTAESCREFDMKTVSVLSLFDLLYSPRGRTGQIASSRFISLNKVN